MPTRLDWQSDGSDWPNREASVFVEAANFRWHVQRAGRGPVMLLLHGTGASTHSVAELLPLLARQFDVVAPDLPGHGFTERARREDVSLPGMAAALDKLLSALGIAPQIAVGHSAGAAVLVRLVVDGKITPRVVVGLNAALLPFPGLAGRLFSPLARVVTELAIVPRIVAWRGRDKDAVARVLAGTGSQVGARQIDLYRRLFSNEAHVAATLDMMAQWDLAALARDLPRLSTKLVLVACGGDEAVPAEAAFAVAQQAPDARVVYLRGMGHLAHEERPEEIAATIVEAARHAGVLPAV